MAQKKTRSKAKKAKQARRDGSERYQKALDSFEKALKALYKDDAVKAKEQFEKILETYPGEKELTDRARSFIMICERKLAPQRRAKTAEEFVNQGVLFLNSGDAAQAIKSLNKALEMEPKNAHIHYCLAAAHAVNGDASQSAKHLKSAIDGDPTSRVQANVDEDFASVRNSDPIAGLLAEA